MRSLDLTSHRVIFPKAWGVEIIIPETSSPGPLNSCFSIKRYEVSNRKSLPWTITSLKSLFKKKQSNPKIIQNICIHTLQGTNISPQNGILKKSFLFPRWDMLIPWRVVHSKNSSWVCGGIWQRFLSQFRHHAATGGRSSSFLVEESIVTRRPLPRNPGVGLGADFFFLARLENGTLQTCPTGRLWKRISCFGNC